MSGSLPPKRSVKQKRSSEKRRPQGMSANMPEIPIGAILKWTISIVVLFVAVRFVILSGLLDFSSWMASQTSTTPIPFNAPSGRFSATSPKPLMPVGEKGFWTTDPLFGPPIFIIGEREYQKGATLRHEMERRFNAVMDEHRSNPNLYNVTGNANSILVYGQNALDCQIGYSDQDSAQFMTRLRFFPTSEVSVGYIAATYRLKSPPSEKTLNTFFSSVIVHRQDVIPTGNPDDVQFGQPQATSNPNQSQQPPVASRQTPSQTTMPAKTTPTNTNSDNSKAPVQPGF